MNRSFSLSHLLYPSRNTSTCEFHGAPLTGVAVATSFLIGVSVSSPMQ